MPLDRDALGRDRWHCPQCTGSLVALADLVDELLAIAPDLQPAGRVRDVQTRTRRSTTKLSCTICGSAMESALLGGVELERCRADAVLWFDRDEADRVAARAAEQRDLRQAGVLRRFMMLFRG
jgi:Zn-finger nucleic acid-binding protein